MQIGKFLGRQTFRNGDEADVYETSELGRELRVYEVEGKFFAALYDSEPDGEFGIPCPITEGLPTKEVAFATAIEELAHD